MLDMPLFSVAGNVARNTRPNRTTVLGALSWVVRNRLSCAHPTDGGPDPQGVPLAWATFEHALASVIADATAALGTRALSAGTPMELSAALRGACAGDAGQSDPTAGALYFFPHWLEPLDARHLRATALIGPFVFFAPR